MEPSKTRQHIHFAGRVQGVGFRATAASLARRHGVTGFVRNLPDGRVEAVVEGGADQVAAFLDELQRVFDRHISDTQRSRHPATGEFRTFDIRY